MNWTVLKFFVNDYLKQEEVLKELGLEESLHEKDTTTPPPIELIENYQKTLEERYNTIKKKQPVSPKWEKVFEEKTKEILIPIFQNTNLFFIIKISELSINLIILLVNITSYLKLHLAMIKTSTIPIQAQLQRKE